MQVTVQVSARQAKRQDHVVWPGSRSAMRGEEFVDDGLRCRSDDERSARRHDAEFRRELGTRPDDTERGLGSTSVKDRRSVEGTGVANTEVDVSAAPDGEALPSHANLALAVIAAAQLMVVLDATIVNIALPEHPSGAAVSRRPACRGCSTPTRWCSAGCCCSAVAPETCSAAGGCSSSASHCSPPRAWPVGSRRTRASCLRCAHCKAWAARSHRRPLSSLVTTTFPQGPARNRAFGVYAAVSGAGAALGPDPRRRPDRPALLAVGAVRQRCRSDWRSRIAAPYVIAETERRTHVPARHPRRDHLDRRHGGAGVRIHPCRDLPLGVDDDFVSFVVAAVLLSAFVVIEASTANP